MPLLIADRLVAGPHVDSTALHLTGSLLLKDYSSRMVAFRIYGAKCIPHTRGLLLPFWVPECVFGVRLYRQKCQKRCGAGCMFPRRRAFFNICAMDSSQVFSLEGMSNHTYSMPRKSFASGREVPKKLADWSLADPHTNPRRKPSVLLADPCNADSSYSDEGVAQQNLAKGGGGGRQRLWRWRIQAYAIAVFQTPGVPGVPFPHLVLVASVIVGRKIQGSQTLA